MNRRTKKPKPAAPAPTPAYPKVVETFREPSPRDFIQHDPSAYNGNVRIHRYRVTVEMIDEPVEVLRDRLRKLWRESEPNWHRHDSMRAVSRQLGMDPDELRSDEQGVDYKKMR